MASPNISRALKGVSGGHRAARIAELSDQVRRVPPPSPVPPPSSVTKQATAGPTAEDIRAGRFVRRSAALVDPPDGHTRLFRVGDLATEHPPVSLDDVITDPWGNKVRRRDWEAKKGPFHSQPAEAMGRWFTDAPSELDFYIKDNPDAPVYHVDVPDQDLPSMNVSRSKFSSNSRNHDREFVLPDEQLKRASRLLEGLRKE